MTIGLLPCPFCNAVMRVESNHDWHRVVGDHDAQCLLTDRDTLMVPATDEQLALAVRDWNRRAPATEGALLDAERYRFVRGLAWYVDRGASVYNINNADSIWRSERGSVDADEVEAAIDRVRLGLEPEEDGEYD
jgi:hypothetical protein